MIKALAKYIARQNNKAIQELNNDLEAKNSRILELLEYDCFNKQKIDKLELDKKTLLDEIKLNQERIDALLRQLRDKNGGQ